MQATLFSNNHRNSHAAEEQATWRLLYLLNIYRLGLSGLLISLFFTGNLFAPLASQSKTLFVISSIFYFAAGVHFHKQIRTQKPRLDLQVYSNIGIDILVIILLTHASGGISSGLGSLMVLPIACGSILLRGRAALFPASMAAISVLLQQFVSDVGQITKDPLYIQAGILGLTYFATTGLVVLLAGRIRESEAWRKNVASIWLICRS